MFIKLTPETIIFHTKILAMKNLLSFLFCCFSICCFAQVNTPMPQEAYTFYRKAMPNIKSGIKNIIEKNAVSLNERTVNTDSLAKSLAKDPLLKHATHEDITAIAVLIMVQISINADADLKYLVIHMPKSEQERNQGNKKGENADEKKAERILRNKSMIAENVSVVMKRISGSQDVVIDNLK